MNRENRTFRLNVRLTEEMRERAQILADELGMPLSTFCALAVGELVATREKQRAATTDSFKTVLALVLEKIGGQLDDFDIQRISKGENLSEAEQKLLNMVVNG